MVKNLTSIIFRPEITYGALRNVIQLLSSVVFLISRKTREIRDGFLSGKSAKWRRNREQKNQNSREGIKEKRFSLFCNLIRDIKIWWLRSDKNTSYWFKIVLVRVQVLARISCLANPNLRPIFKQTSTYVVKLRIEWNFEFDDLKTCIQC